jgi:SSS family solute:Na+ symporter
VGDTLLHPVDLALVALYVAGLLYLGLRSRRPEGFAVQNYLLGGRRLTLVPFVATLVSTWYGGILGVGEFTYQNGIVNLLVFGIPYYIYAALYAVFLAPRIRGGGALTIPERFHQYYGPGAARFGAVIVFLLTTPAPYLLMLGIMLNFMFGLPLWSAILLGTIFSTVYLWRGGFLAVIRTDLLQFALMFTGFAVLLGMLMGQESLSEMWHRLPTGHRDLRGPESMGWQVILVWFLIASWTFVDPGFYQRSAAARDGKTAARGIFISVGFWLVFDLLTTATGLYAVSRLPDLALQAGGPVAAYPLLGLSVLPVGLRGLFMVALLAVIMSTVDSFAFISATTIGRDFFPAKSDDGHTERKRIQWGIIISCGMGYVLAVGFPSVVELWYGLGMLLVPGLLLPVLATFTSAFSLTDRSVIMVGSGGVITAAAWQFIPQLARWLGASSADYPLGLQPMIPGLLVTILLAIILGKVRDASG